MKGVVFCPQQSRGSPVAGVIRADDSTFQYIYKVVSAPETYKPFQRRSGLFAGYRTLYVVQNSCRWQVAKWLAAWCLAAMA